MFFFPFKLLSRHLIRGKANSQNVGSFQNFFFPLAADPTCFLNYLLYTRSLPSFQPYAEFAVGYKINKREKERRKKQKQIERGFMLAPQPLRL